MLSRSMESCALDLHVMLYFLHDDWLRIIGNLATGSEKAMERQQVQVWKWLIGILAVFWIIFAIFLFNADIPFIIVSMALTIVLVMSALVVALAWAYQHDY